MSPYAKEIFGVVILKLVMLFLLWWFCFSESNQHHLSTDIREHLLVASFEKGR